MPYDPVTKTGSKADYYTYGTICTEVEIDVLTGENQVIECGHVEYHFIKVWKYRGIK